MSEWKIDLTAPNGAKANAVISADADEPQVQEQIANLIATARDHDPEQMEGVAGQAPPAQVRRSV